MSELCPHCGRALARRGQIEICLVCNELATAQDIDRPSKLVIDCPGATLYDVESGKVICGVQWRDPNDITLGYDIVDRPIFAPHHTARRLIDPEQAGRITRCQACQDYTIRGRARQRDHKVTGPSAARRRAENLFRN